MEDEDEGREIVLVDVVEGERERGSAFESKVEGWGVGVGAIGGWVGLGEDVGVDDDDSGGDGVEVNDIEVDVAVSTAITILVGSVCPGRSEDGRIYMCPRRLVQQDSNRNESSPQDSGKDQQKLKTNEGHTTKNVFQNRNMRRSYHW